MKGNLDELEDNDDPFYNNIIDYYVHRPEDLENVTLAEFVRDYKIVYRSKAEQEAEQLVNADMNDDYTENEMAPGAIRWLLNKKRQIQTKTISTLWFVIIYRNRVN